MAQPSTTQRRAQMQRRAAAQRRATTTRRTPTTAPRSFPGRKKPQQSTAKKLFGTLSSALPVAGAGKKAKRSASGRKPSKGLLVLGAGAGLAALKNRDKLKGKLPGQSTDTVTTTPVVTEPAPVAHNSGAPAS